MRAFQLCERIGCPHPDHLPEDMTPQQLGDWDRYDREVGSRDEWAVGRILAMIANVNRREDQPAHHPRDYMIGYDPPMPSEEELDTKLRKQLGL